MFEKLEQSSGRFLGYKAVGKITKEDYTSFTEGVQALLEQEESICLLLDLEEFDREKISAWGADLKFGREFRHKITKMAVVGQTKRQEWMTGLMDPLFADEAKFFPLDERDAAWDWLQA